MIRGMYRGTYFINSYSYRKLLRHTAEAIIPLLKGEEVEMLSGKNIIHMRDRGFMKIDHTTPEEAKKHSQELKELFDE